VISATDTGRTVDRCLPHERPVRLLIAPRQPNDPAPWASEITPLGNESVGERPARAPSSRKFPREPRK
jgi:hypothetical protein